MKQISSLGAGANKKVLSLKMWLTHSFPESQMIKGAVGNNDKTLIFSRKVPVARGVSSTEVGCVLQGVLALH